MKNLIAWLNNNNYSHQITQAGESNYFYNAPGCIVDAAQVEIVTKDIHELNKKADKLQKYIKRYNYNVYIEGRLQCDIYGDYHKTFFIMSETNAATLENYYFFRDAAIAECEILQHEYYKAGRHEEVNAAMKIIMDKYGTMYNRSLFKIIAA